MHHVWARDSNWIVTSHAGLPQRLESRSTEACRWSGLHGMADRRGYDKTTSHMASPRQLACKHCCSVGGQHETAVSGARYAADLQADPQLSREGNV